ncbi:UNVERIFIED_CONTAM: uncharacterized protein DUF3990 [Acetivibrio alkalicellulosi]
MNILKLERLPEIVYHGTTTEYQLSLEKIKVDYGRKDLDFGQGFYTTSIKNVAIEWAKGKVWNNFKPLVLTYRVNIDIIKSLKHIHFISAGIDWVNFVYKHRMELFNESDMNYEFVYGHMADGLMSTLMGDIKTGKKTYEDFKTEIYPRKNILYYDQLFFRTESSLNSLDKIEEEVL